MTEIATTFETPDSGPSATAVTAMSSEGQAVITEQQVLFSTAAAVALPQPTTRRFSGGLQAVAAAVAGWLASAAKPPARPVYPKRHVWLENSLMTREMDRL